MKRYFLFAGVEDGHACGGWKDFQKDFDTKQEVLDAIWENSKNNMEEVWAWWHLVDTESGEAALFDFEVEK